MPKVAIQGLGEIDEEDVRASVTLRNTIGNWMKNPAARRKMLEAHKTFDPKAEIPELDQPDPLDAKVSPLAAKIADLEKQIADDKAAREQKEKLETLSNKIETGLARIAETERLTPEGIAAVRKLMEDEGITNPEIAWSHFQRLHPPQMPVTPGGNGAAWNFMDPPADDQVDLRKLIETKGESEAVVNKLVRDTLGDLRGQGRR
jgi:hypothetical protein